jgi:multisubunit Na+/H+ antiporter MnhB subunit
MLSDRLRKVINPEYERNVRDLLSERSKWKKTRDVIEVSSKIMAGFASVIAFASTSVSNPDLSHWLGFSAGCTGTVSLALSVFANYSATTSRDRTRALNRILKMAGVTPVPQLVVSTDMGDGGTTMEDGNGGATTS